MILNTNTIFAYSTPDLRTLLSVVKRLKNVGIRAMLPIVKMTPCKIEKKNPWVAAILAFPLLLHQGEKKLKH